VLSFLDRSNNRSFSLTILRTLPHTTAILTITPWRLFNNTPIAIHLYSVTQESVFLTPTTGLTVLPYHPPALPTACLPRPFCPRLNTSLSRFFAAILVSGLLIIGFHSSTSAVDRETNCYLPSPTHFGVPKATPSYPSPHYTRFTFSICQHGKDGR
jgi:hypothetical protein